MMTRPGGEGVETPILTMKPRGLRIDEARARLVHDLLCWMCLHVFGLSVPETLAVMNRPIKRSQLYDRQAQIGPDVERLGVFKYVSGLVRSLRDAG